MLWMQVYCCFRELTIPLLPFHLLPFHLLPFAQETLFHDLDWVILQEDLTHPDLLLHLNSLQKSLHHNIYLANPVLGGLTLLIKVCFNLLNFLFVSTFYHLMFFMIIFFLFSYRSYPRRGDGRGLTRSAQMPRLALAILELQSIGCHGCQYWAR